MMSQAPVRAATRLPRPERAEGAGRDQSVDEAIKNFFEGHAPGMRLPYRIGQGTYSISEKGSRASDSEDSEIRRTLHESVSCEIGDKDTDQQTIREPHSQMLAHV